jgi:hypothetical protein
MAIIQISKIQQRSGDLVDLPQLSEAEFGFATDEKRLFIGKTTDEPENIEVLTSYSEVSFSQIDGAVGNLNIDPLTIEEGQVLAYNSTDNAWENRGGNSGGAINLGDAGNLTITGGAIGYVLQTDGTGNLSWQPKGVVTLFIENITQSANAVITFTDEFALSNAQGVTITGVTGMTQVNGQVYYLGNLTTTTANLYTDNTLTTPLNSSGFNLFPYTSVSNTFAVTNDITVANAALFSAGNPVQFIGNTFGGIESNKTYYIISADATAPGNITISETQGSNVEVLLSTASGTCNVYVTGGKAVATVSGAGGGNTGTSANTQVLFNLNNVPAGDNKLTFNYLNGNLVLAGNAAVSTLTATGNATANILVSTVTTGTAPLTVTSTTKVTNLNVDFLDGYDSSQTATANTVVVRDANGNVVGNSFTGNTVSITGNANVGNIGSTDGVFTGNVTVGNLFANSGNIISNNFVGRLANGNSNVNIPAANGNVTISVAGNANIVVATGTGVNVAGTLNASGNANVGNLGTAQILATANVTTPQVIANIATGTAPFVVNSTTRVSNLNVNYSNVTDFSVVTLQNTGSYFLPFISGSASGNYALNSNATFTANLANGSLTATTFVGSLSGTALTAVTVTGNAQPNITSVGTLTSLAVSGNITAGNVFANSGVIGGGSGSFIGNVTAANLIGNLVGNILTNNITTGSSANPGNITGNWTLTGNLVAASGSRIFANYADLAEYYSADQNYIPGTVLEFGGDQEVTIAGIETSKLAGVVSSEPAYVMNGGIVAEHPVMIALIGRVPVKVIGKIRKGDMLISAGNGLAKAAITIPKMGTVIGKALQNFDGEEGVIEVVVGRM